MKKCFSLLLFLLLTIFQYSQTISVTGNIKDLKTNSPIENAKVQIKNLQNGSIDSAFSDAIGNWQYDVLTSVVNESIYLPNSLVVYQNFPNPFNPSTKINFSIPSNENIIILLLLNRLSGDLDHC